MLDSITDQRCENKSLPHPRVATYSYQHPTTHRPEPTMITRPLVLHRSLAHVLFDAARERVHAWHDAWRARAERRMAEAVEHELLALDSRTLSDIGAPQGLVGQRRWQDEESRSSRDRMLDLRGW
jgi:hypothetical protein